MAKEPHKANLRKSDPVARFQQYNHSWKNQKAPGERQHKNLRWSVREHMLYHDEVVQKVRQKNVLIWYITINQHQLPCPPLQ